MFSDRAGADAILNQFVEQGGSLLFVDGHEVSVLGAKGIVQDH